MIDFLLADFNTPYIIALTLVLTLALLEGFSVLVGLSLLNLLDNLFNIDIDADVDLDATSVNGLTALLGWLCLHKLPMLVWLILMLTGFGLGGVIANYTLIKTFTIAPVLWISLPFALLCMTIGTKVLGQSIARVFPKNESTAISAESFSGKLAEITIGKASKGNPAEAVLIDEHNQKHYVMVEPCHNEGDFTQGTTVVLISKHDHIWSATRFNSK